jgi:hypothetical protein
MILFYWKEDNTDSASTNAHNYMLFIMQNPAAG